MKKNIVIAVLTIGLLSSTITAQAFAHVVVRPAEVGVAERVNFSVSVPTEKDMPTIGVRLVIPEGVTSVRPNVKAGWNTEVVTAGEGDAMRVTEIIWTGGNIPQNMRDEFVFSGQAPAKTSNVVWKAYQTYADGSIVAWEADPKTVAAYEKSNPSSHTTEDANAPAPYSVTKVVNDLADEKPITSPDISGTHRESFQTLGTIAALALATVALITVSRKK